MGATNLTGGRTPSIPAWARDAYVAAQAALDAGHAEAAERAWRAIAARRDGDSPWPEILGLTGISTIYGRQGRVFEALVLYRRLGARLLALGEDEKAAGVLGNHCLVLNQLRSYPGLPAALAELEAVLARLAPDDACTARDAADVVAVSIALAEGRLEEARARLAAHDTRPLRFGDPLMKRRTGLSLASLLASAEGDAARADALLDEAEALGDPEGHFPIIVQQYRLAAARASGDPARRRSAARAALAASRGQGRLDGLAARRAFTGGLAAEELVAAGAPAAEIHEAYDLVATALLARIVELDAAVRALPTLGLPDLDAARELAAFRDSCLEAQGEAMRRVARWFGEGGGRLPRELRDRMLPDGWAHVCAWCQRLRPAEGTWLPIGQFLRHATTLDVTHTICPGCATTVFGDARATASA